MRSQNSPGWIVEGSGEGDFFKSLVLIEGGEQFLTDHAKRVSAKCQP
jgi:hypothetical protein